MGILLQLYSFTLLLLQPSIGSSPSEFINDFGGYQSVCRVIGWQPGKDCAVDNMINVIAFHANLYAHAYNMSTNTKILFGNVQLNKGNGYDLNTGIFTAPEAGVYYLAWSLLSKQGGTVYVAAVVDNIDHTYTCINNQQSTFINTSGYLLYELKKGSKVWLRTWNVQAKFLHRGFYTYFSGHRINSI